jgi:hypothetical protein
MPERSEKRTPDRIGDEPEARHPGDVSPGPGRQTRGQRAKGRAAIEPKRGLFLEFPDVGDERLDVVVGHILDRLHLHLVAILNTLLDRLESLFVVEFGLDLRVTQILGASQLARLGVRAAVLGVTGRALLGVDALDVARSNGIGGNRKETGNEEK